MSSPTDTSNFDVDDNDLRQCDTQPPQHNSAFSGLHLPFAGFSFTINSKLSDLGRLEGHQKAIEKEPSASGTDSMDGLSRNAYERRINRLEDEKKELVRKLGDSNRALQKFAHGPISTTDGAISPSGVGSGDSNKQESSAVEIRKLQDELNTLTKRNNGTLTKT